MIEGLSTLDFKKYFESIQKPVHILSVTAFFWDVGKTLIEGWESLGSFALTLSWVVGWLYLTTMLPPIVLLIAPMFLPFLVYFVGLDTIHYFHPNPFDDGLGYMLLSIFILFGSLFGCVNYLFNDKWGANSPNGWYRKYTTFVIQVFLFPNKSWGVWVKRFSYFYFSVTAIIGIILSSTVSLSENNTSAVRIVGWFMIGTLLFSCVAAMDWKALTKWRKG
jgi:hypothetical protein